MLKDKTVSVFLVFLVSVLCPAACGLRAAATEGSAPAPDCCGDRLPTNDRPHEPIQPNDQAPDACFCSTQGVTLERSEASHLRVQPLPFIDDAHDHVLRSAYPPFGASRPFCFRPPDPQRILPLLV